MDKESLAYRVEHSDRLYRKFMRPYGRGQAWAFWVLLAVTAVVVIGVMR